MTCHTNAVSTTVVMGQQGRLVLPAEIRATLGLEPGQQLRLRVQGRSIVLERPEDAAAALRGFAVEAGSRSLVEELIAERRAEAAGGR